jgi:hypothetical protein
MVGLFGFAAPKMSLAQAVTAKAKGEGVIANGEYAGKKFKIELAGAYSGFGAGTLVEGRVRLKIGKERFESIISPDFGTFNSFCCGEGRVDPFGAFHSFSMNGQVRHVTAAEPHNHLFGASATTDGLMCFNLADQSGTIVTPTNPPHDPGVGLICDIPAKAKIKVCSKALSKNSPIDQDVLDELEIDDDFFNRDEEWAAEALQPTEIRLVGNYPNPFSANGTFGNPGTEIRFQLPEASQVVVKIFNILGAEVRTLAEGQYEIGSHHVRWDGKDNNGHPVASGIYLYQLRAGAWTHSRAPRSFALRGRSAA